MYIRELWETSHGTLQANLSQVQALMAPPVFGSSVMADSNAWSNSRVTKMKWNVSHGARMDNTWQLAVEIRPSGSEKRMIRARMRNTIVWLWPADTLKMLSLWSGTLRRTCSYLPAMTILSSAGDMKTRSMIGYAHTLLRVMSRQSGSLILTELEDIWSVVEKIRIGWFGIFKNRLSRIKVWFLGYTAELSTHVHGLRDKSRQLLTVLLSKSTW